MIKLEILKRFPPLLKEKTAAPKDAVFVGGKQECSAYDKETGRFIFHYIPCFVPSSVYGQFFSSLKYNESVRLSGLISKSQIFGFAPRDYLKNLPTRRCRFDSKNPKAGLVLQNMASTISKKLQDDHPDVYEKHHAGFVGINKNWVIPKSVFSSGIINLDTKYLYHTDNGNVDGCISGMITLKNNVSGGDLHLPEYNYVLQNNPGSLLLFDGASVSHGVTGFKKTSSKDSYRITIVWYVLENLKLAMPTVKEELDFFNSKQLQKHEKGYYSK